MKKSRLDICCHLGGFFTCKGVPRGTAPLPPPALHTVAKDMSLNRDATHFTLGKKPCIPKLYVYLGGN